MALFCAGFDEPAFSCRAGLAGELPGRVLIAKTAPTMVIAAEKETAVRLVFVQAFTENAFRTGNERRR